MQSSSWALRPLAGSSSSAGCQWLAGLSSQIREGFGQTNKTELSEEEEEEDI